MKPYQACRRGALVIGVFQYHPDHQYRCKSCETAEQRKGVLQEKAPPVKLEQASAETSGVFATGVAFERLYNGNCAVPNLDIPDVVNSDPVIVRVPHEPVKPRERDLAEGRGRGFWRGLDPGAGLVHSWKRVADSVCAQ